MKTEKISEKYSCVATCPMRNVIAHFANKWSMLLIVILDEFGVMRFNELKKYTGIASCPVRNVISRFSGKWTMLVLCVLAENETTRFNEIGRAIPDISPKVLTDTLKSLEADGLISRKLYAEIPPKVEYSLTELGKSLIPLLGNLIEWALDNFDAISKR